MVTKLPHLQGTRGLAIVAVVLFHFIPYLPNGFLGVDMFFVLSGYLMPFILSREEKFEWPEVGNFWYRRIKRICPLYYAIVLLITGSLYLIQVPNLPALLDAMINSLQFTTNFMPSTGYDYFFKLAAFIDPFTHTWSLCVEMQFYLLFPILYFIHCQVPPKYQRYNIPWAISGSASLIFYAFASVNTSFNCVLARLWQFTAGILTFNLTWNKDSKGSQGILSPSWAALVITVLTLFAPVSIAKNYSRLLITCIAPILISHGAGNYLLENHAAVFLGEISYSWYLIHFPIISAQRLLELHEIYYYPLLIALSVMLATVIHYTFEKQYLRWNYLPIFLTIFSTIIVTMLISVPLSTITDHQIVEARHLAKNYSHLNKEEVIKFNLALHNLEGPLCIPQGCHYPQKPLFKWGGYCEYEEPYPKRGNNSLMIVGNSWTANSLHFVHEECEHFVKNISAYTVGGCDVLPDVIDSCTIVPKYEEYIEKVKPDVLFIISRPMDLKHIDDGMLPLEDSVFASSLRRLQRLETWVQKKIFILNAFPNIHPRITSNVNNFLKYGAPDPADSTLDLPNGVKVARMRTEELVRRCEKCELFDYIPYLSVKRKLTLYDPETFVTYANSMLHLTLAGLEKVRPVFREICQRIPSL